MSTRTLFVGDVHGCAAELGDLLDRAAADRVILLGDLFTKGPDPEGVWQIITQIDAESLRGNHDDFVLNRYRLRGQRLAPQPAIDWLATLPLFKEEDHWIAVHAGLHPIAGVAGTSAAVATRVRRWPDDADENNPFWWELYTGERLVIYGHDARRMLQDHRPRTMGLDTGCVYGGRLTGYLLEEDAVISVPARAVYQAV